MKKRLITILILFMMSMSLQAQLLLHPAIVFMDKTSRTGSMTVVNGSNEFKEVNIDLKFGYYTNDSTGKNNVVIFNDTINEKKYSLVPYIKVYPPKLLIPPNQTASIRFIVRGVPDSVEQFYWTRIIASATTEAAQVDTSNLEGKISARFLVKSEFNGFIAYMSGKNTADLDFDFLDCYSDSDGVNLVIAQKRTGNSPFWGTLYTEIYDSDNKLVDEKTLPIQEYFNSLQSLTFKKENLKAGQYKAKITVTNERKEVPPEFRSNSEPKKKTFTFQVK